MCILITMVIGDFVFQILGIVYMHLTKQLEEDFPIPGLMKCILLFECYNNGEPHNNGDNTPLNLRSFCYVTK